MIGIPRRNNGKAGGHTGRNSQESQGSYGPAGQPPSPPVLTQLVADKLILGLVPDRGGDICYGFIWQPPTSLAREMHQARPQRFIGQRPPQGGRYRGTCGPVT